MSNVEITINLGTVLLVNQILKQERGIDILPKGAAKDAIAAALKAMEKGKR